MNMRDEVSVNRPRQVSITDLVTTGLLNENDIARDGTVNEYARRLAEREYLQLEENNNISSSVLADATQVRAATPDRSYVETIAYVRHRRYSSFFENNDRTRVRYSRRNSTPLTISNSNRTQCSDDVQSSAGVKTSFSSETKAVQTDISDNSICCICMMKQRDHIFLPCCHFCACEECANKVVQCPLCRSDTFSVCKIWS